MTSGLSFTVWLAVAEPVVKNSAVAKLLAVREGTSKRVVRTASSL